MRKNLLAGILSGLLLAGVALSSVTGILGQPTARGDSKDFPGLLALATPTKVAAAEGPNFLHTSGSKIVDSQGNVVQITGINWFGMETGNFAPHGIWSRNYEEMLDQIVELGFNTIRLPYSNEAFDAKSVPEGIDYKANPDLVGLKGIEIMDKIVEGAGKRGLKVLLDRHRPGSDGQSNLWYTPRYSEERWIADWKMLAERYNGNDTVIGADLHNEPHGEATWGSGEVKTDWRLAAERAGNAILEVNPNLLIVVEGIDNYQGKGYWWGGDLTAAAKYPVRLNVPNQLVYSAHDYGPGVFNQNWFIDSSFPNNMPKIWDDHWGYLVQQDIAPVILGEFGGRSVSEKTTEGVWQRTLMAYLKDNQVSYTYWSLNPNSGDTGGVLNDDWVTVNQPKLEMLQAYQDPFIGGQGASIAQTERPQKESTSVPSDQIAQEQSVVEATTEAGAADAGVPEEELTAEVEAPVEQPKTGTLTLADSVANTPKTGLLVQYKTNKSDTRSSNPSPELKIVNKGPTPIALSDVELKYWFTTEPDYLNQALLVDLDWTSVGWMNVAFNTPQAAKGNQNHYLSVTFKKDAGVLQSNGEAEVKARIHKLDWSDFDQTKNYSFLAKDSYSENPKVTAYVKGDLAWGAEPS